MAARKEPEQNLTPEQRKFVKKRVKAGTYRSQTDVVNRAFSLLEDHETAMRELRRKIDIGMKQIDRGEVIDGEAAFASLLSRGKVRQRR